MKPSIPRGTCDFHSEHVFRRRFLIKCLQSQFEKFGFSPIETPSFENLSTLIGKYGKEGDSLIFKILNSGNFFKNIQKRTSNVQLWNSKNILKEISNKGLRYDLTVPLVRFVSMNYSKLVFPFKRYQIQPVWRADRPQKGRFREFYQCDADVIGSDSLNVELDLILLYDAVFSELKLPVTIHINNRKILLGIAEIAKIEKQILDFTIALDKLEKIGEQQVIEEMISKGISKKSIELLRPIFQLNHNNKKTLNIIKKLLSVSEIGKNGIRELEYLFNSIESIGLKTSSIQLNCTLARGLNYYTGSIFEVKAKNIEISSIGGGGRYDKLTELFNLKGVSGVGISFGLDRIDLVMEELQLFQNFGVYLRNDFLFVNYGENESLIALKIMQKLRKIGKKCELYPKQVKLNKQFKYAKQKNYENMIFLGENEIKNYEIKIKNLSSRELKTYNWNKEFEINF